MSKLNPMTSPPDNMRRVLVYINTLHRFEFAFYKDGMYQIYEEWLQPDEFDGWITQEQLKHELNPINEEKPSKTHMVIDTVYYEDEGNEVFAGTQSECYKWMGEQGDFGYEVLPMTLEKIEYYKKYNE